MGMVVAVRVSEMTIIPPGRQQPTTVIRGWLWYFALVAAKQELKRTAKFKPPWTWLLLLHKKLIRHCSTLFPNSGCGLSSAGWSDEHSSRFPCPGFRKPSRRRVWEFGFISEEWGQLQSSESEPQEEAFQVDPDRPIWAGKLQRRREDETREEGGPQCAQDHSALHWVWEEVLVMEGLVRPHEVPPWAAMARNKPATQFQAVGEGCGRWGFGDERGRSWGCCLFAYAGEWDFPPREDRSLYDGVWGWRWGPRWRRRWWQLRSSGWELQIWVFKL